MSMYSPDVSMGLGSVVYALAKLDGHLQKPERDVVQELLAGEPYSDLAICACFLRDNVGETTEEAYAFGLRRMADQRIELTKQTKKRFIRILLRVAKAHEGISREERTFIRAFWQELQRL
ncbi:tellurite resistance TerB family protein [Spirosoma knui]